MRGGHGLHGVAIAMQAAWGWRGRFRLNARLPVSALGLGLRKGLWVPLLLAVVALGLFLAVREMAREARLLASEGVQTTGVVLEREHRRRDGSSMYFLRYEFTVMDGTRRIGRQRVSRALHDRARPGASIMVHYAQSRPSVNRVQRGDTIALRLVLGAVSGLLVLGAGFLTRVMWGDWRAMLRAARRGERGEAWVIAWHECPGGPRKGGKRADMTMAWRDDNRNRSGQTGAMAAELAARHPAGSRISIWYDPHSERGFWEESILPGSAGMRGVDAARTGPRSRGGAAGPFDTKPE